MEKIFLVAFYARVLILAIIGEAIKLFSKKQAEKFYKYVRRIKVRFGRKAIRKGWTKVLSECMDLFSGNREFRRDLFVSRIENSIAVKAIQSFDPVLKPFQDDEVEFIALSRKFNDVETTELLNFKKLLLSSKMENKREIVKLFYKNTAQGEPDKELAGKLVEMFSDDPEFIFWLVMRNSAVELNVCFVKHALSNAHTGCPVNEERFRSFVKTIGFSGMKLNSPSNRLLLEMREYLERPEDIAVWEEYLLNGESLKVAQEYVRVYGIKSASGIQRLLQINDHALIKAYNEWKAA